MDFECVKQQCYLFLMERLNSGNCIWVWTTLESVGKYKDLVDSAFKIAKYNFLELTYQAEYLQLDFKHLLALLLCEDLDVYSEEEVFYAMVKWVIYDEKRRRRYFKELLSTIRLTALKSEVSGLEELSWLRITYFFFLHNSFNFSSFMRKSLIFVENSIV